MVTTRAQTAGVVLRELPLFGEDIESGPAKPSKSKTQKHRDVCGMGR